MILAATPLIENERMADLLATDFYDVNKIDQFNKIISILSRCFNVPIAYITSVETDEQKIHASCGLNFKSSERSTSFCGHTILGNTLLVVEDTYKDERFFDNPLVIGGPKIRFYAGFPLKGVSNQNIGTLCIADVTPRRFSEEDTMIFTAIGELLIERMKMLKLGSIQKKVFESKKEIEKINKKLTSSNQFYQQLFGQYMSDSLLNNILDNKKATKLGGEQRFVTILMSDLRGFTKLSEISEPAVIIKTLNFYLDRMIDIVHKHEGYINEILGDGILVVFGAPNHLGNCAKKAVLCAQEMQDAMIEINEHLNREGLPELAMGIGINSGNLIVGNIGSKKRMKYGVVGNAVNIAARIEALALPGQILLSEVTFSKVNNWVKPIGNIRVKVKGIDNPISIYDVSNPA